MKLTITAIATLLWFSGIGQTQLRIYKVDTTIGQTVFCRAREMKTDSTRFISIHFRGAGRKPNLIGMRVTFHPYGKGRIRHQFYGLNR